MIKPERDLTCPPCFGPGASPRFVYAKLGGVGNCDKIECHPPPSIKGGAVIRLEQDSVDPCLYLRHDGNFSYRYYASPFASFRIVAGPGPLMFNRSGAQCQKLFANALNCEDFGVCGSGGSVRVYYETPAFNTAALLNIPTGENTYFEGFYVDESTAVDRFANKRLGINIKIKHTNG